MLTKKEHAPAAGAQTRARSELKAVRLTVYRSNLHIYAQVIDATGGKVLASGFDDREGSARCRAERRKQVDAAKLIGKRIAERRKANGVTKSRSTAPVSATTVG
jgi:large subunit ribosomal protein L18